LSILDSEAAKPAVREVQSNVDSMNDKLIDICDSLWNKAELSLIEFESAELIIETLTTNGFKMDSIGTSNIPTAFVASYGSGSPTIGVMVEYDGLPGLGQEAIAERTPRKDGKTSGHGCGHNVIGAGGLGAALALKTWMGENSIAGTLKVFGAAAEETEGAKIYMARDGLFDDLDACLHLHPLTLTSPFHCRTAAVSMLLIDFEGRSAHAGATPWQGRSALHAAELFAHGVAVMREHLEPTARTHYIYTNAGVAPNVVVEKAQIKLLVRDIDTPHVAATTQWVKQIAEGCAMATQTKSKCLVFCGMHDLLPNAPMANRIYQHMTQIGLPEYTEEEQEFAKKLQISAGKPPTGMKGTIVPPFDVAPTLGGSTDVGDVSYNTPTMGVLVQTIPPGCGVHTWQAAAAHGMSLGHKAMIMAAKTLASLGCDLFTDADLLAAARADYEKRKGAYVYKSPLSPETKRPLGLDAIETGDAFLAHLHCHDPGHDQCLAHMEQHIEAMHGK
jgi:aminobenzoyl-glutamate utilization protein B